MSNDDAAFERRAADLLRWLVFDTQEITSFAEVFHGFARRLNDGGLDLFRVNMQAQPLSPQASILLHVWRPSAGDIEPFAGADTVGQDLLPFDGGTVQTTALAHGAMESTAYTTSPFFHVITAGEPEVRRRILPAPAALDFPVLAGLRAQGATDYIALPVAFRGASRSGISFVTKRPGGFTDAEIDFIKSSIAPMALALSPLLAVSTMHTLLGAYLGPKTAERVMSGKVQQGDVEEVDAAIWFSDLRGFTPMSAAIDSRELIAWLNDYFAAVARAITKHDGEILKFIGDAILAVWPATPTCSREATCRAALAAARDANRELDALNDTRAARGLGPLRHGIGLHVGPVQYGNIGAERRLDFTVIGPAVNMAARLESACGGMSQRLIASAEVAACVGEEGLRALGETRLKGIDGPCVVFGAVDEE